MTVTLQSHTSSGKERRAAPRVSLDFPAAIRAGSSDQQASVSNMVITNISETGLGIVGSAQLHIGTIYNFLFKLSDGTPVNGKARIVWKHPNPYIQTYGARVETINWWGKRRLLGTLSKFMGHKNGRPLILKLLGWSLVILLGGKGLLLLHSLGWPVFFLTVAMGSLYWFFFKTLK
ncbi:MAG: PilZ domain-containing protein [Elusimicrobia bacterium]|nr:PilZ domain-containing protein [Elusimicrobiota bacterium]